MKKKVKFHPDLNVLDVLKTFDEKQLECADTIMKHVLKRDKGLIDQIALYSLNKEQSTVLYYLVGKAVNKELSLIPSEILKEANENENINSN